MEGVGAVSSENQIGESSTAAAASSYTYWVREATQDAAPPPVPRKLTPQDLSNQSNPSTHLGSAWNKAGTWEEKNLNRWASDRIKGLLPAVQAVLPNVEHRHCVFHMLKNFKKQFKGEKLKEMFIEVATAYSIRRYNFLMKEFQKKERKAYEWIVGHPPLHWARSHFRANIKSDILYNNLCEFFNSKLVPVRDKPLISLLEGVRHYLMKRIAEVRQRMLKCRGPLCPDIQKQFEKAKSKAAEYICKWNGADEYELSGPFSDQQTCDLKKMTCSCKRWDITGIPCKHAISAIYHNGKYGGSGVPEEWVDNAYKIHTWEAIYSHTLHPLTGPTMWEREEELIEIHPPYHHVQPGRPRKLRQKDNDEDQVNKEDPSRLSRKKVVIKCSLCGNAGHNRKTCTGQGGTRPPMVYELLVSVGSLDFSSGKAEIEEVSRCVGDAFLVTVRNKKRFGYTYELTLRVKGEWLIGEEKKKVKGQLDIPEFSFGEVDDLEMVVKVIEEKDLLHQDKLRIIQDMKLFLKPLREKLLEFEQELKDR